MNVYLDIDGVLLANDLNPAKHVHEFLERAVKDNDVYWLTTHCQGDATTAVGRLKEVFEPRTIELLKDIKPTKWKEAKTEAIDFTRPFIWFDDDLFFEERKDLLRHNALENWIEVNLSKNENQLLNFVKSFPLSVTNL